MLARVREPPFSSFPQFDDGKVISAIRLWRQRECGGWRGRRWWAADGTQRTENSVRFFCFFCECVCACATFKKAHFWAPARTRSRTSRRNGMASSLDHFFFPSLDEPLMQSNERSAHAAAVPSLRELLCPQTARLTQAGPALRRPHCIPLRLCAILFFYKILNLLTKLASCLRGG